jgi:hypothetical protein
MGAAHKVALNCFIFNAGPGSASEVFVLYEVPPKAATPEHNRTMWKGTASGWRGTAVLAERSIHPEEMIHLFEAALGYRTAQGVNQLSDELSQFKFSISARNQLPRRYSITVRADEVEDKSMKKATLLSRGRF